MIQLVKSIKLVVSKELIELKAKFNSSKLVKSWNKRELISLSLLLFKYKTFKLVRPLNESVSIEAIWLLDKLSCSNWFKPYKAFSLIDWNWLKDKSSDFRLVKSLNVLFYIIKLNEKE